MSVTVRDCMNPKLVYVREGDRADLALLSRSSTSASRRFLSSTRITDRWGPSLSRPRQPETPR